jgi:hypothetical protein
MGNKIHNTELKKSPNETYGHMSMSLSPSICLGSLHSDTLYMNLIQWIFSFSSLQASTTIYLDTRNGLSAASINESDLNYHL